MPDKFRKRRAVYMKILWDLKMNWPDAGQF
ncbi:hypothetical protein PBAL39_02970 [Pedobacter sp. BAL39]|nr:hypothetical protein PBAL39_02970 [Pedobacter sp. BAL39]